MLFRSFALEDNYSNMIPQITKEIKYKQKISMQRQSNHRLTVTPIATVASMSTIEEVAITTISLDNHQRCHVEDFTLCSASNELILMVPTSYVDNKDSK